MKFSSKQKLVISKPKEHVLVPYFEETNLSSQLQLIPLADNAWIERIKPEKRSTGQTLWISTEDRSITITLMYLGRHVDFELMHLKKLFAAFGNSAEEDCQILLEGLEFDRYTEAEIAETIIKAMYQGAYTFSKENLTQVREGSLFAMRDQLKEEKNGCHFTLINSSIPEESINRAETYGKCINYARMLGDLPNNYLHVKQFADYLMDLAKEYQLAYEILGREELEALHSGGILGINAGSEEEPKLISIYYEGLKGAPVTALIGKGVMFDSGGYHLKSISGMQGMKYDMCGAANMAAAFEIAVRQKSQKNILLVIPAVENVIGPNACKMGDVLTTMSGKTVEVYNIDAEGRLILCDAITYATKIGADYILDLATLTYSCQRSLGNELSGVFSNQEEYYEAFVRKTKEQCEKVWRLPLDSSYHELLYNTQTADLINYAPGSDGGASVAACFLEEFITPGLPWIHMDIVGSAVNRGENKLQSIGATGVLTASIAAFLE